MSLWSPVNDDTHKDWVMLWWVVPKTTEEAYCDTSGNPIIAQQCKPRIVMGKYGSWSSLQKATHWHPLPNPPESGPNG